MGRKYGLEGIDMCVCVYVRMGMRSFSLCIAYVHKILPFSSSLRVRVHGADAVL